MLYQEKLHYIEFQGFFHLLRGNIVEIIHQTISCKKQQTYILYNSSYIKNKLKGEMSQWW